MARSGVVVAGSARTTKSIWPGMRKWLGSTCSEVGRMKVMVSDAEPSLLVKVVGVIASMPPGCAMRLVLDLGRGVLEERRDDRDGARVTVLDVAGRQEQHVLAVGQRLADDPAAGRPAWPNRGAAVEQQHRQVRLDGGVRLGAELRHVEHLAGEDLADAVVVERLAQVGGSLSG
ncbi:MAG: hypothetical protein U0869_11695 [Chloroflexota bacterium]